MPYIGPIPGSRWRVGREGRDCGKEERGVMQQVGAR